jgi:hypothetical protein
MALLALSGRRQLVPSPKITRSKLEFLDPKKANIDRVIFLIFFFFQLALPPMSWAFTCPLIISLHSTAFMRRPSWGCHSLEVPD